MWWFNSFVWLVTLATSQQGHVSVHPYDDAMPMYACVSGLVQMQAALDANPAMQSMLSDPEMLRQMLNPANLRALMQMQQAMASLGGGTSGACLRNISHVRPVAVSADLHSCNGRCLSAGSCSCDMHCSHGDVV